MHTQSYDRSHTEMKTAQLLLGCLTHVRYITAHVNDKSPAFCGK